ncbi:MAG: co-chaperone Hsc20 [Bacteroidota bacterium]|jgi:molecular chaperone HscB
MNYFEFYNLPVSFKINNAELKKKYFEFSKLYHPDFFTNAKSTEIENALEKSTLNTNAFKVLSSLNSRMKYILELKEIIHADEKFKLPNDFLLEMMDLNEAIDELQFEQDAKKKEVVISEIKAFENQLQQSVQHLIDKENVDEFSPIDFEKIKEYYFKKKYLNRLEEQITKVE